MLETNQDSIIKAIKAIRPGTSGQPAIQEETLERLMEMLATLNEMLRRKQKPETDYNQHFASLYSRVEQIAVSKKMDLNL